MHLAVDCGDDLAALRIVKVLSTQIIVKVLSTQIVTDTGKVGRPCTTQQKENLT